MGVHPPQSLHGVPLVGSPAENGWLFAYLQPPDHALDPRWVSTTNSLKRGINSPLKLQAQLTSTTLSQLSIPVRLESEKPHEAKRVRIGDTTVRKPNSLLYPKKNQFHPLLEGFSHGRNLHHSETNTNTDQKLHPHSPGLKFIELSSNNTPWMQAAELTTFYPGARPGNQRLQLNCTFIKSAITSL